MRKSGFFEPHPKSLPSKLEISNVPICFFAYSSGVILSSTEWGLIAMAGVLGIIGFIVIRRKKSTV